MEGSLRDVSAILVGAKVRELSIQGNADKPPTVVVSAIVVVALDSLIQNRRIPSLVFNKTYVTVAVGTTIHLVMEYVSVPVTEVVVVVAEV